MAVWCSSAVAPKAVTSSHSNQPAMQVAGRYRVIRHSDHALPAPAAPRALLDTGAKPALDVRAWRSTVKGILSSSQPALLVHAPKRTGSAVERNRFKRRTRMALLRLLVENPVWGTQAWTIWVRPAKGAAQGCRVRYQDIEGQLRLALLRLG